MMSCFLSSKGRSGVESAVIVVTTQDYDCDEQIGPDAEKRNLPRLFRIISV